MGLKEYQRKRKFQKTPEPKGKIRSKDGMPLFVVQKHAARNLHYDFRLEAGGVLKSWAVPKGPSMNPKDKRLAMMVEDHPYDYKDFEGVIAEGNYGAGEVIVWDTGNYLAVGAVSAHASDKIINQGITEGRMSFVLNGKKLKGEFSLVRLKAAKGNSWLLIKKKDRYALESDILVKAKSVISGKTVEMLRKGRS